MACRPFNGGTLLDAAGLASTLTEARAAVLPDAGVRLAGALGFRSSSRLASSLLRVFHVGPERAIGVTSEYLPVDVGRLQLDAGRLCLPQVGAMDSFSSSESNTSSSSRNLRYEVHDKHADFLLSSVPSWGQVPKNL